MLGVADTEDLYTDFLDQIRDVMKNYNPKNDDEEVEEDTPPPFEYDINPWISGELTCQKDETGRIHQAAPALKVSHMIFTDDAAFLQEKLER